jgi:hypothetical protein
LLIVLSPTIREERRVTVFENRGAEGGKCGPERDEVTGGWSDTHDEELHNFYSSPNLIRTIKSRRMRWVGYVEKMGENYIGLFGKREGKRPVGRLEYSGRVILSRVLKKENWLRIGTSGGLL